MKSQIPHIVSVDIGGTFCDACYESGQLFSSIKLLSNGRLRATIKEVRSAKIIKIDEAWGLPYPMVLKGCICTDGSGRSTKIDSYSAIEGVLCLNSAQKYAEGDHIEISGSLEAPVFAAHLLTGIPMDQHLKGIELRIGTTKGTNAILELKGTPCIWITNEGFKDLLYIKSQQRPHLFQLAIPEPKLLHYDTIETNARITVHGKIIHPLSDAELKRIITLLPINKETPIAISLLNSYNTPDHELLLKKTIHRAGYRFISCSHELLPTIHILPRSETAVCNAYLSPIIHRFIATIQDQAHTDHLYLISSAGQAVPAHDYHPKDSLFSGPAGGIKASESLAKSYGLKKVITFDMGGTSTDTARIDEHALLKFKTKIDQFEIACPAFDIETVAAGGGSIIDFEDGRFTVGPASAGADPGPACYGRNGPLTITDINLLLGRLVEHAISIPISMAAAQSKWDELKVKSGISFRPENESVILKGILQIANEKMAEAVRKITFSQGHNPAQYSLLVYGGAGGLHACAIAELLQISTIIIPYRAGIFSASGMPKAPIERTLIRQINKPLEESVSKVADWYATLTDLKSPIGYMVRNRTIHLKYKGQNQSIVVDWKPSSDLKKVFTALYKKRFKATFSSPIEIDKIQVDIIKNQNKQNEKIHSINFHKPVKSRSSALPWLSLKSGDSFQGPLTIYHHQATVFIPINWSVTVQSTKDLILKNNSKSKRLTSWSSEVELELFNNRFKAIAEQMGAQLQHSAFSVNVKERLDFSCAILDSKAKLIANAPHIPVHLGSLGVCARLILKKYPLEPGDIILCNHPKYGGSHLPDLTLLMGVFDRQHRLIGYVINRAHHAEIGGLTPGSMPPHANTLEEEGVVFLPTYIQRKGIQQWDQIKKKLTTAPYPTRDVHSNILDLQAALFSLSIGEKRLQTLCDTYGLEYVHLQMNKILTQGADEVNWFIKNNLNSTYTAIEKMDDGRIIKVQIKIKKQKLIFDFSGSALPHEGNLNANPSIVWSVLLYILRLLCRKDINLNEGLTKNVRLKLPFSFLHPRFKDDPKKCPAVVGGNTEVSQRLTDTLIKALRLAACSQGTMNNFLFGNDRYSYYETIGGGVGAGLGFKGRSAVHQHMTNTKITDPEEMELRYPVLVDHFKIRPDSGGIGKYPGGHGISRQIKFLEPMTVTIIAQHRNIQPYGMNGGGAGSSGQDYVISNGKEILVSANESIVVSTGDSIRIETPGGGSWGKK